MITKKVNNLLDNPTAVNEMDTYTLEICKCLKPLEKLVGTSRTFCYLSRINLKKYMLM